MICKVLNRDHVSQQHGDLTSWLRYLKKFFLFIKNLQNFLVFFNIRITKSVYSEKNQSLRNLILNESLLFYVLAKAFMIGSKGEEEIKYFSFQEDKLLSWHNHDLLKISLESRNRVII